MDKKVNGMAIAGFVLSLSAVPLLAAAFLCLIGMMLIPFLSVIFGEAACLIAIGGIVLSAIGVYRSYGDEGCGAGMSLAGLVVGTVVVTLVLAVVALLIVDGFTAIQLPHLIAG